MAIQEVQGDDYQVQYNSSSTTVDFKGELSLGSPKEYEPITTLLNEVVETSPPLLTLDLRELAFMNSSGISMLSKFVLGLRKRKGTQLVILGSRKVPWQNKSLKNLERLLPGVKLEFI